MAPVGRMMVAPVGRVIVCKALVLLVGSEAEHQVALYNYYTVT